MNRGSIFRFRLTEHEAERLDNEAAERGITKADRIREALGWKKVDRAPQPLKPQSIAPPSEQVIDPERQPGLSAIQELAKRLKGTQ